MKIIVINKKLPEFSKFESFVAKHGLLFNSPGWINNYPENKLFQCAVLNRNDEIIGCFVYYVFSKSTFKFLITPPFAPDTELFYLNPAESVVGKNSFDKELMTLVSTYFNSLKVDYISINFPSRIIDTQPFTWQGFTAKTRYSYLIDLTFTTEQLTANLSSEKRKSLNKAEKDGVITRLCEDKDLVFDLILKSLSRNEIAKNVDIIKSILYQYADPKNSFSFVSYYKGQPAGVSFCLIAHDRAIYLFGGMDTDNKHHGAGVSCMWQSILTAKEKGLRWFDFEGSMNVRIERYFREFGGTLTPYFCVEKMRWYIKWMLLFKKA